MTNPSVYLPASSQSSATQPEKLYHLSNQSKDSEGLYSLTVPDSVSIRPGLRVKFYSSNRILLGLGFITRISSNSVVFCKSFSPLSYSPYLIEFLRGWSLDPGVPFHLYDPTVFVSPMSEKSLLSGYCSYSGSHKPGLIRWSLLYLNEVEGFYTKVLDGNDAQTVGLCTYQHDGRWKPGTYELRAERYSPQSSILLSSDTQIWTLESSSNQLSCGGYSDPLPLLLL